MNNKIKIGVVLTVLLLVTGLFVRRLIAQHSSPWYGRQISTDSPRVLTGLVDPVRGLPGLLALGMTRQEVYATLGKPVLKGTPADQAIRSGFDPSDVGADFFDGVYAWVHYGQYDRVIGIEFDLKAYQTKYNGQQVVALRCGSHSFLLSQESSRKAVIQEGAKCPGFKFQLQGRDLLLLKTGTSLLFDDTGKLSSIWIID